MFSGRTPEPSAGAVGEQHADLPVISPVVSEPPFWGRRELPDLPLPEVLAGLDTRMLFGSRWGFRRGVRSEEEYAATLDAEARPILQKLLDECGPAGVVQPRAVYGYWPCRREGDRLLLFDSQERTLQVARLSFPAGRAAGATSLAAHFAERSAEQDDVVALWITTAGLAFTELIEAWQDAGRAEDAERLAGLGHELADAAANWLCGQIRVELGLQSAVLHHHASHGASHGASPAEPVWGRRVRFGDFGAAVLAEQRRLWPLLKPQEIGVTLSTTLQLQPVYSSTGMFIPRALNGRADRGWRGDALGPADPPEPTQL